MFSLTTSPPSPSPTNLDSTWFEFKKKNLFSISSRVARGVFCPQSCCTFGSLIVWDVEFCLKGPLFTCFSSQNYASNQVEMKSAFLSSLLNSLREVPEHQGLLVIPSIPWGLILGLHQKEINNPVFRLTFLHSQYTSKLGLLDQLCTY